LYVLSNLADRYLLYVAVLVILMQPLTDLHAAASAQGIESSKEELEELEASIIRLLLS
jgi:hypothetical protein